MTIQVLEKHEIDFLSLNNKFSKISFEKDYSDSDIKGKNELYKISTIYYNMKTNYSIKNSHENIF